MRTIKSVRVNINTDHKPNEIGNHFRSWLEGYKPELFAQAYLLSFHEDGVVWGKLEAETRGVRLVTSDELKNSQGRSFPSPEFRGETLQECRLFSEQGELLVWRNGNDFKARLIEDNSTATDATDNEYFDERQILWGTLIENGNDQFTIVADGSEGLRHAFPQRVEANRFDGKKRPLRLKVRHYLSYDKDGCAYVSLSRLVNVEVE